MGMGKYQHVFGITTVQVPDVGEVSVYTFIRTFEEDEGGAIEFVETLKGTIFLYESSLPEEQFRAVHEVGGITVQLWTAKSGWRRKDLSTRPLV